MGSRRDKRPDLASNDGIAIGRAMLLFDFLQYLPFMVNRDVLYWLAQTFMRLKNCSESLKVYQHACH